MFGSHMPDTDSPVSSLESQNVTLQIPNPSFILSGVSPDSTNANPRPATFSCPVSGCSSVFKGKMAHGYLWRHLGRPGVHGLTGDEKATWQNLHGIEHDRLLATRSITPPFHKLTPGLLTNSI